jgi:hypothetical protein
MGVIEREREREAELKHELENNLLKDKIIVNIDERINE